MQRMHNVVVYIIDVFKLRLSRVKCIQGQRYIWQHPVKLVSGIIREPRGVTSDAQ